MARETVLTALGYSADLDDLYRRLRPQSGRQLTRIAAALFKTPEELLDDIAPLVEGGVVRVDGASPVETLRREVEAQAAYAGRAQRLLGGVGRAIEVLAAEQRLAPSADE